MTKEELGVYDNYLNRVIKSVGNKKDFLSEIRSLLVWIDDNNFDEINMIGKGYAISE